MYKLGVIGCGNMGGAIVRGALKTGLIKGSDLIIYDHNKDKVRDILDQGASFAESEVDLVDQVENLMLAVKPQSFKALAEKIKGKIQKDCLVISIAAGLSLEDLEKDLAHSKILRAMPNTPALVNEAMTCLSFKEDQLAYISFAKDLFQSIGQVAILDENKLDAFSGLAGCMPAFVYMFIEAAADAGVKNGIKRQDAYDFVAQALLGSAKMVLETKIHPGQLKDQVCSPGGTTIQGVLALEEAGFRNAVIKAVDVSTNAKVKL
ncbi:MAG: pyrroline-5-carboxylate reductase [Bacillota bacterium]|nr:pyrroline-5-carboxylate reductase [Bacillota bacterium]